MALQVELTEGEVAQLREFARQVGRSPVAVATEAVRDWIEHRAMLAAHLDRVVTEDAELRRLADS